MIIGITRNTQAGKEKIKDFLTSKYGFKYIDVDQILEEKILSLREGNEFPENWRTNRNLLFQIRNSVDLEIQRIVESSKDETIVLDYSLLENSYYFDNCDLVIKSNFNINKKASTSVDLYKKHQANSVSGDYSNSKYQLEVNFDENWEEQIQQYLDFNVFGEDKVTVVVPIYNTADYISRCVKSITSQTYRNLEILLIVDGATDESLEICTILANQDPRIKVIYQSNKGLAETRNEGMKHATGEYICFIDSDDYIENPMIETLLKTIKETNITIDQKTGSQNQSYSLGARALIKPEELLTMPAGISIAKLLRTQPAKVKQTEFWKSRAYYKGEQKIETKWNPNLFVFDKDGFYDIVIRNRSEVDYLLNDINKYDVKELIESRKDSKEADDEDGTNDSDSRMEKDEIFADNIEEPKKEDFKQEEKKETNAFDDFFSDEVNKDVSNNDSNDDEFNFDDIDFNFDDILNDSTKEDDIVSVSELTDIAYKEVSAEQGLKVDESCYSTDFEEIMDRYYTRKSQE